MLQILVFSIACYMLINSILSGTSTDYLLALGAIALFLAIFIAKKK